MILLIAELGTMLNARYPVGMDGVSITTTVAIFTMTVALHTGQGFSYGLPPEESEKFTGNTAVRFASIISAIVAFPFHRKIPSASLTTSLPAPAGTLSTWQL